MNILFFEPCALGHIIEYVYNILSHVDFGANQKYILVTDSNFIKRCEINHLQLDERIKIVTLTPREEKLFHVDSGKIAFWKRVLVLRKYIKRENADKVFLNYLISYFPIVFFLLPRRVRISGIIYKIFIYDESASFLKSRIVKFIYKLFASSRHIQNVYLLNDTNGPEVINNLYKVEKFKYLADPISPMNVEQFRNVRDQYGISQTDEVFLQYGMEERKSPFEILQAIDSLSEKELAKKVFVFAGYLDDQIKDRFYETCKKLEKKAHLVLIPGYLPYPDMHNLFYSADVVFTLYTNISQSSGFIGYAAYFKKFVIGTGRGLLGRLISENNLGIGIDINITSIRKAILSEHKYIPNTYVDAHSVKEFACTITSEFR